MSFKATFIIDNKEYNVLACNYNLHQDVDVNGRPSSVTRGSLVSLIIESSDDSTVFEWMCDSYLRKDSTIRFNKRDEEGKLKELEIADAYVVDYAEDFDSAGNGSMIQSFTLSARNLKWGNGEHDNEWTE